MLEKPTILGVCAGGIRIVLLVAGLGAIATIFLSVAQGTPPTLSAPESNPQQDANALPSGTTNTAGVANDAPAPVAFAPQTLPKQVVLRVPFSPQAPLGDWSQPYEDACEETSVLMSMAWVRGDQAVRPEQVNQEILGEVAFENFNFGYHKDTAIRETAKLFTRYYNYENVRVVYDIALDDIKRELAAGNLVIVPTAGSLLKNPYYASPPPYHMVVVRGYDDIAEEFIVNDPGTKRGASYRYSYETLLNTIHDWTGSEETILEGRTGMIVVLPRH